MNDAEAALLPAPTTIHSDIELDPLQVEAIQLCVDPTHRIVGVTGGAGTGKTTILKYVYEALIHAGYTVRLCSPTGKASKRVKEATGIDAVTIHRLLEFSAPSDTNEKTGKVDGVSIPGRHQDRRLPDDVILVDEYSMVNRDLHASLIAAIKPGGRLIAFGDLNQLPPIEEGVQFRAEPPETPFHALLRKFPHVRLQTVHRQAQESGIISNAHRVLRRMAPRPMPDFEIRVSSNAVEEVNSIVSRDPLWATLDYQVITPMNKTHSGTVALNGTMQTLLEPNVFMPALDLPRHEWDAKSPVRVRVGTKVIQVKNDYNLLVFNGESGVVSSVDPSTGEVKVNFGDHSVAYPKSLEYTEMREGFPVKRHYDPRKNLYLAYAITTHKAQGSEFKVVLYIMSRSMFIGQSRANLYTGITRARERVILVTDSSSLTSVPMKEK